MGEGGGNLWFYEAKLILTAKPDVEKEKKRKKSGPISLKNADTSIWTKIKY